MRSRSGPLRRWQFSVSVIAPAAIFLVLTAGAVVAFVMWTTRGIDERSLARQTELAATAVQRHIAEVPRAQESIAIWDDTIVNIRDRYDQDWLDQNVGVWMWDFYGFDATAVLDARNEPIYTMAGGRSPSAGLFLANRPTIRAMAERLRADLASGALLRYQAGETPYPRVLDIRAVNGTLAVVSILPIVPQTDAVTQAPGAEYLHLVIDYLDSRFAAAIAQNYKFEAVGFDTSATPADDRAAYPVLDANGRVATFFQWQASRPGSEMLAQAGPILAVAFLAAGILVAALVLRLWQSSAALEAERLDARRQAMHDALTGLPNRVQFESQLERMLRHQGHYMTVSLLMLDLDHFKQVNDTLGHRAGDELICAVGQRLRELIGPGDVLARLGGDEFAIVHAGRDGQRGALDLASSIIEAVAKPFDINGGEAFVGTSIGLAVAGKADRDQHELARRADIALYEAKSAGRGRVLAYREAMGEQLQDRHMIEAELREALKRDDQLSVAFQPLYSAKTGQIAGAEALVRWNHPRLGQVSPARFIPIAEGAGLIEALGEFVLLRACRFGARWPGRRMAVNISPAQLRNPRFAERVFDLMVENAMRPSDLELEITENILLDGGEAVGDMLVSFRNAGIRIALDDFGTGYSSLNYLKRYPVDSIKIDRSFVAQLAPKNASAAIVQAMVTLAHALDIDVTAEGVETHEQMTILKAMGCNLFQGFLLSPPTTEAAVEQKFSRAAERNVTVARIA